ncbi:NifB/NifX family molybdenum-iron cluster-binding protein [Chloroflexota bacterium]
MNVLIAADGTTLDSAVAKRFGHAPYYLYVDADTGQIQIIENTDHDDETHAIIPQMIQQGADVFITGNIGAHAFQLVRSLNRQVALARKMSAVEALEKLQENELEILKAPTVKQSFHDHRHHLS